MKSVDSMRPRFWARDVLVLAFVIGSGCAAAPTSAPTSGDGDAFLQEADRRFVVEVDREARKDRITIVGDYVLTVTDRDGDGVSDMWLLERKGVPYVKRWARSGKGAPDAVELFDSRGKSTGGAVWGHYREEEADRYGMQMDEEIRQKKEGERLMEGSMSANQRLDATHSGVTALAQGRKRRATGRARQAQRYAYHQ
jgi:hypothetical protein